MMHVLTTSYGSTRLLALILAITKPTETTNKTPAAHIDATKPPKYVFGGLVCGDSAI